jgi:lipopolysaccharide export system protein LptA
MRFPSSILSLSVFVMLLCSAPPYGRCLAQEKALPKGIPQEEPIVIHSDTLLFDQQQRIITFKGKVKARSEDMEVDCQEMIVYLRENPSSSSTVESGRIEKIIALGDVVITTSDGGKARAGKAVFYQSEEKAVLTENPSVQQGPDLVEGYRIEMYLRENRSIIEGSPSKRVKATLFPQEEKGEQ